MELKLFFLLVSLAQLVTFKAFSQASSADPAEILKPTTFYIAEIKNESSSKAIAFVRNYVKQYVYKNAARRPVVLILKELKLTENAVVAQRVNGHISLVLSFGLQKNYGVEHLVDYKGKLNFNRMAKDTAVIERYLPSLLKAGLLFFNDWMIKSVNTNRKLASNVKIRFTTYSEKAEGDTIYYAKSRPLTWADFQSKNRPTGYFQAYVIPGIGYEQTAQLVNGTIEVDLKVKAFLPKSASWAESAGRDEYALNHEQRHFDMVKIISEQFKQKIIANKLTPDNYEAIINMEYLDSLRDLDAMQKAYDKETAHGQNRIAQADWNERIDKELLKIADNSNRMLP
ncbi:hypothetical protein [Pedobacter sp.]|uniref:hypothetical protein n=1 Tax=Pedobacter sp. TaxID=1411316 RepID=UPI003D7F4520